MILGKRFTAALATATAILALAGSALHAEPVKVGFVYVGPTGDFGWTYEHDQGRLAVEEAHGDKVETTFIENVPEGTDAERVLTQMALSGHDLIFTTSFGYMDPTINVAKKFPDVHFEHATGYKREDNVSTYSARFYEGRAVIGHIAGKMTKTNTIGYIASFPIPEVVRGINAAYIHAKRANPDVDFKIVWVFTWFDPAKEADAATTLMKQFGPNARLSSIIDNWAPYYVERVGAEIDGTWSSIDVWHGIKEGMVEIGEFSDQIPEDVQAAAQAISDSIVSGEYHPFTGPLNRQDGSPWLAESETASDGDLLGMNFYVEGLEGAIPQ